MIKLNTLCAYVGPHPTIKDTYGTVVEIINEEMVIYIPQSRPNTPDTQYRVYYTNLVFELLDDK